MKSWRSTTRLAGSSRRCVLLLLALHLAVGAFGAGELAAQWTPFDDELSAELEADFHGVLRAEGRLKTATDDGIAGVPGTGMDTPVPEDPNLRDPRGTAVSRTTVMALILVCKTYSRTAGALADQFEATRTGGLGEKRKRLADVEEASAELAELHEALRQADAAVQEALYGDVGRPSSTAPQERIDEWNRHVESLRATAAAARDAFVTRREELAARYPELAVEVDGVPLWQALPELDTSVVPSGAEEGEGVTGWLYERFTDALAGAFDQGEEVPESAKMEIYNTFLAAGRDGLRAQVVDCHQTVDELWKYGSGGYQTTRDVIRQTGLDRGAQLPGQLMDELEGVYEAYDTHQKVDEGWTDVVMATAGALLIPLGPAICAGYGMIEIVKEGSEVVVSYRNVQEAEARAPIEGYRHVITREEQLAAESMEAAFTVVTVAPDFLDGVKSVRIVGDADEACAVRVPTGTDEAADARPVTGGAADEADEAAAVDEVPPQAVEPGRSEDSGIETGNVADEGVRADADPPARDQGPSEARDSETSSEAAESPPSGDPQGSTDETVDEVPVECRPSTSGRRLSTGEDYPTSTLPRPPEDFPVAARDRAALEAKFGSSNVETLGRYNERNVLVVTVRNDAGEIVEKQVWVRPTHSIDYKKAYEDVHGPVESDINIDHVQSQSRGGQQGYAYVRLFPVDDVVNQRWGNYWEARTATGLGAERTDRAARVAAGVDPDDAVEPIRNIDQIQWWKMNNIMPEETPYAASVTNPKSYRSERRPPVGEDVLGRTEEGCVPTGARPMEEVADDPNYLDVGNPQSLTEDAVDDLEDAMDRAREAGVPENEIQDVAGDVDRTSEGDLTEAREQVEELILARTGCVVVENAPFRELTEVYTRTQSNAGRFHPEHLEWLRAQVDAYPNLFEMLPRMLYKGEPLMNREAAQQLEEWLAAGRVRMPPAGEAPAFGWTKPCTETDLPPIREWQRYLELENFGPPRTGGEPPVDVDGATVTGDPAPPAGGAPGEVTEQLDPPDLPPAEDAADAADEVGNVTEQLDPPDLPPADGAVDEAADAAETGDAAAETGELAEAAPDPASGAGVAGSGAQAAYETDKTDRLEEEVRPPEPDDAAQAPPPTGDAADGAGETETVDVVTGFYDLTELVDPIEIDLTPFDEPEDPRPVTGGEPETTDDVLDSPTGEAPTGGGVPSGGAAGEPPPEDPPTGDPADDKPPAEDEADDPAEDEAADLLGDDISLNDVDAGELLNSPMTVGFSRDPSVQVMIIKSVDLEVQPSSGSPGTDDASVPGGGTNRPSTPPGVDWRLVLDENPELEAIITSLGASSGEAFNLVMLNRGSSPVQLSGDGLVVEPLELSDRAREELEGRLMELAARNPVTMKLTGYCLQFLRSPPAAGQLFRIASQELQNQFAPVRNLMRAADRVRAADLLNPDSDPDGYFDSITQWAIWSVEQDLDLKGFEKSFLERTKKNFEAAGRAWSGEIEQAVRGVIPNRWNDIQQVLTEAERLAAGA